MEINVVNIQMHPGFLNSFYIISVKKQTEKEIVILIPFQEEQQ